MYKTIEYREVDISSIVDHLTILAQQCYDRNLTSVTNQLLQIANKLKKGGDYNG